MHDPPSKKLKLSATSTCSITDTLSESTNLTNLSPSTSLDTMLSASPSPGSSTATCTSSATSVPASHVHDEATPCFTPNCPVSHTPPQPGRCERCEKYSKKAWSLSKKHNRLNKKYSKLENKLK